MRARRCWYALLPKPPTVFAAHAGRRGDVDLGEVAVDHVDADEQQPTRAVIEPSRKASAVVGFVIAASRDYSSVSPRGSLPYPFEKLHVAELHREDALPLAEVIDGRIIQGAPNATEVTNCNAAGTLT
jgi:hypothetical protein